MAPDIPASPPEPRSAHERAAIRMIPFIVGCALFMQMLDSTVVATALPVMADALNTTPVKMNVAITSYLLALAVFVPVSGWAADRFGARKVFITAIVMFTVTSVACALAQNLPQLVVSRTLQGVAGAMMVPVGRVLLLRMTPKAELLRAMTFLSMPALLGPIVGPPLGGFLVTYATWHWIFLINIPVGILGVALVLRYISPDIPEDATKLDWRGFILSGIGLACLVSGFESIGDSDVSRAQVLLLLGVGLACGLLYIWHAKYHEHPIIDLSLLKVRSFAIATLGGNLCRLTVGASPFLLAMMLQVGFGMSAFAAGMITFSSAAGDLLMKLVATPVINRFGFNRVLVVNAVLAGALVMVCGLFNAYTPVWVMIGVLLIGGVSRSLQFTAVNTLTYADLGSPEMGRASSFSSMMQQLAISLGVGGAALVLNLSMSWRGAEQLAPIDTFWAFMILGLMACLSMFSFMRLPDNVASHLRTQRKR